MTQTVDLAGRTYTFTTEHASDGVAIRCLGSLWNSRGQFYGLVTENKRNGVRIVIANTPPKCARGAEHAALAAITA